MQLPSGFPVKIEIPLFHVINARITFSNIQVLSIKKAVECKQHCYYYEVAKVFYGSE